MRGCDGGAVALGVAGHTPDGHVDAVPGGGAVLFGLATPEAVLAVLACPLAALREHFAVVADGAGLGLTHVAGLGTLAGGGEEEVVLPSARGRPRPGERAGEDQARDSCGFDDGHQETPVSARMREIRGAGGGNRLPESSCDAPCCPLHPNLSNS